jgi:membrane protease YdiL (CAAX protease family)
MAAKSSSSTGFAALIGLAVAFAWPLLLTIPGVSTHSIVNPHDDLVDLCLKWFVVAFLCAIAFAAQRWPPSEFGIRWPGWRDLLASLAGVILAFVLSGAASRFIVLPSSVSDLQKLAAVPVGLRILVVLTAAVTEEFIYRGFAIEELAYLIGKRWLAGLLSLLLFTVSHAGLYGMSAALIVPFLVGAVLTGLYLWRSNLWSCMLMHAIIDGIMVVVIPAAMQAR